ncbi:MAG TPA: hypothetical protein DCL95_01040, partial [Rhodospirillaceae bacterium]|nr:hypothetical protein [Rhodospirillaceae bacterium]
MEHRTTAIFHPAGPVPDRLCPVRAQRSDRLDQTTQTAEGQCVMSLLSIKSLSKNFGGLQALNQITLDVTEGSVHGLMGANGAGKTTLFSIIAGNQRATTGTILFAGQPINGLRPDQVCKRGISRTFQIVRPFAGLTVRENVEIAILYGRQTPPKVSEAAALAQDILADIGLDALSDQPAGSLT